MERIFHLDLKGAPWKIDYLEKILQLSKSWGATGVLFEWEDTFPYTGDLAAIGSHMSSEGLYSMDEVRHLLNFSRHIGLEAIQLTQTIGHMEFVLKHPQFRHLRELDKSPAVLCPSHPTSRQLVKEMLRQVIEIQPGANYLHIGADEVWHMAVCEECKRRAASSEYRTSTLYLDHIRDLALFVKGIQPNVSVLIWDDMLRSISSDAIRAYNLRELVQPVIWHYSPKSSFHIDPALWVTYRQNFSRVWAGSAFKGANGSCQILSPVSRYVSNNESWIQENKNCSSLVNFVGIILTGWSRFDHYATLCELLPVSLPSLASCLKLMANPEQKAESVTCESLPSSEWPGEQLARCVHSAAVLRDRALKFIQGDLMLTWLNPWQVERNYTNPAQIENIVVTSQHLLSEIKVLQGLLTARLLEVTTKSATEEWVGTFISPVVGQLSEIYETARRRFEAGASVRPG